MRKFLLTFLCVFAVATSVFAADPWVFSVDFKPANASNGTANTSSASKVTYTGKEGHKFECVGFNNNNLDPNWDYIRCGQNNKTNPTSTSTATITLTTVPAEVLSRVEVITKALGSANIASLKELRVVASETLGFTNATTVASVAALEYGSNVIDFTAPVYGKYIRLEFETYCNKNNAIPVSQIEFGGKKMAAATWNIANTNGALSVGEGFDLGFTNPDNIAVTYTEANGKGFVLDNGKIYPTASGVYTITAASAKKEPLSSTATGWNEKSQTITLNVEKYKYFKGWEYNGQSEILGDLTVDAFVNAGATAVMRFNSTSTLPEVLKGKITTPKFVGNYTVTGDADVVTFGDSKFTVGAKPGKVTYAFNVPATDGVEGLTSTVTFNVALNPATWTVTVDGNNTLGTALAITNPANVTITSDNAKEVSGQWYATKAGQITLKASSAATATVAAKEETFTVNVAPYAFKSTWTKSGADVTGQTLAVDVNTTEWPVFTKGTVPAIFATLGIAEPVLKTTVAGESVTFNNGTFTVAGKSGLTSVTYEADAAAANANYAIAPASVSFMSGTADPTWTVNIPAAGKVGEAFGLTMATKVGEPAVKITCSDVDALKVVNDKYYFVKAGTFTLTPSSEAKDGMFNAKTGEAVQVTVAAMPYTLTWKRGEADVNGQTLSVNTDETSLPVLVKTEIPAELASVLTVPEVTVTALEANSPVAYDAATGVITLTKKEGTQELTASISDSRFTAASATVTLTVAKKVASWTFDNATATVNVADALTFEATGVVEGEPAVTVTAPAAFVKDGGKYYPVKAGEYTITASSPATDVYAAKTVTKTVKVEKLNLAYAWMLNGENVNGKELRKRTAETLPTFVVTGAPANLPVAVSNALSLPDVDVEGIGTVVNVGANNTLVSMVVAGKNVEGKTTVKAHTTGNEAYNAVEAVSVTLDLYNSDIFNWANTGRGSVTYGANWKAEGGELTMGGATWTATATPGTNWSPAFQIGSGAHLSSNVTLNTAAFAGKRIRKVVFEMNTNSAESDLALTIDGMAVKNAKYSSANKSFTWDLDNACGSELGLNLCILDASSVTPLKLFVEYSDVATKVNPTWAVTAPANWKLGEACSTPEATGVAKGLEVTYTPAEADFVVVDGKWYAKHAGQVTFTAATPETTVYNAVSKEVTVDVAKAEYLAGWALGEVAIQNGATVQYPLHAAATPELKATVFPAGVTMPAAPAVTTASSKEAVAKVVDNKVVLVAEGETTITVSVAGDANYAAQAITLNVNVTDAPVAPVATYNADANGNIKLDEPIVLTSETAGTNIKYKVNGAMMVSSYTGPIYAVEGTNKIEFYAQNEGSNTKVSGATFTVTGVKYNPSLEAATVATLVSTKTALNVAPKLTGDFSKNVANQPKVTYTVTEGPATVDANGNVTFLSTAKNGDKLTITATGVADTYNNVTNTVTVTTTLTTDYVAVFDFTKEGNYDLTTIANAGPKSIGVGEAELVLDGRFKLNTENGTTALRYVSHSQNAITIKPATGSALTVVNVAIEGDKVAFANVNDTDGEVANVEPITSKLTTLPTISRVIVRLAERERVFNFANNEVIEYTWENVRSEGSEYYINRTNIYDAKYEGKFNYTFEPMFEKVEGAPLRNDAQQPVDYKWFTPSADWSYVADGSFNLFTPVSGLYKLTLSLKTPMQSSARFDAEPKTVTVAVKPSFVNSGNGGAPLQFGEGNVKIVGNQLMVNVYDKWDLTQTFVKYEGEGTMSLWMKITGTGLRPGTAAAAPRRVTALKGETVNGAVGTPVEGYVLYGADGIDFRKGNDLTFIFEKNGAYSDPIHFTAVEGNAETTDVEMVGAEEGDVEYFTVDGVKIGNAEDLAPGMYVKKVGDKATLVIIK